MKKNKKAVIILSGGMDSTTLLYDYVNKGYDIHVLSFNYNQKHKKELSYAKKTCEKLKLPHKIINLKVLNEIAPSALTRKGWTVPKGHYSDNNMKQTVVPNRNMVMLSLAVSYAISIKAKYLFYGAHSGDHAIYPDCRQDFISAFSKAVLLADWHKITVKAPYVNMDKSKILRLGKKLNVDYSLSWTCYEGKKKACGKCGSCVERLEAFKNNKMVDPVKYE